MSIARSQSSVPLPATHVRHGSAFTLIELLVVVAVLAVLTAIAVPNLLDAQIRAKVAKTKNALRIVAGAFEAYQTDLQAYPPWFISDPETGKLMLSYYRNLTTPVAYLTSAEAALDPFPPKLDEGHTVGEPYLPHISWVELTVNEEEGSWRNALASHYGPWLILSYGPSGHPYQYDDDTLSPAHGMSPNTRLLQYDPTNGTHSHGVIAWSQKLGLLEAGSGSR